MYLHDASELRLARRFRSNSTSHSEKICVVTYRSGDFSAAKMGNKDVIG